MFPRLAERRGQPAGTLSGGEQQMLAIGRCLMGAPELIMFDEPSLGLAPAGRARCSQPSAGSTRRAHHLLVEQNVAVSLKLASRAYVLENGRITLEGAGDDLPTTARAAGLSRALTQRASAAPGLSRLKPQALRT